MAVTENQIIKRQDGNRRSYPVKASTKIYDGTLVFLTTGGYADDDTATGVNGFVGIANGEADNSSGSDGDITVEVFAEGDFVLVGAGTYSQADVGSVIYGDDNYTINTSIGSTSVPIGKCVGFVSATKLIVEIEPVGTGALPVAALTTITHTSPGTPDYAIANVTSSSPFGFSTADEGNTVLSVIRNLQIRVADLEARRS
jgi:hypothetical protein